MEVQIKTKLDSDETIDFDYWEQLLRTLRVFKAKAKLRRVSQDIVNERLQSLRKQQEEAALSVQRRLQEMLAASGMSNSGEPAAIPYDPSLDPQPLLKLRTEDKVLEKVNEKKFLESIVSTFPPSLHAKAVLNMTGQ